MSDEKSGGAIGARLSVMMFIQFFIWGAWYVGGPNYLTTIGFGPRDFAWMYSVGPLAGIISPFFVGMIADRYFSAERVLGVMHLLAGVAMLAATRVMTANDPSPNLINLLFFIHMLCYFPTLALTNTLALKNMTNAEKQFPMIRVFGTIGWIVIGQLLSRMVVDGGFLTGGILVPENSEGVLTWDKSINMFYITAASCFVLGVYSFTLPHTPPVKAEAKPTFGQIIGLDAFVLLKNRSFLIFMFSSFLICIPLAFYYQIASRTVEQAGLAVTSTMSYGQVSEVFFMVAMPLFFARLGVKWMLLAGMMAWVVRYALFAMGAPTQIPWMILTGVVLHGICYDFFFVTGQIYTDKMAPESIRGQAQGMLVLFTLGLGMLIGAQTAGYVEKAGTTEQTERLQAEAVALGEQARLLEDQLETLEGDAAAPVAARLQELEDQQTDKSRAALQAMNWRLIWGFPAVMAAVVMVLFLVLFKDDPSNYPEHDKDSGAVG